MKILVALAALSFTGCATLDFCDLTQEKRCAFEAQGESKINGALVNIGSALTIDPQFMCPGDPAPCPAPAMPATAGEEGDFQTLTVPVPQ